MSKTAPWENRMPPIATNLARLLNGVQRPGDFYTFGTCEIFAPGLEIRGVGPIALPLLPVQAQQLVAVAERAPYGRGEETLVDTEVRRTWQISSDRVQIHGRAWARTLETMVARVAEGLGVSGPVAAEFYKLLVYDEGGFFASHRDSEKTAGMFATLIVVLPSIYTGGELLIRHQGREVRIDLQCPEPSEAGFVAFYADCVHEVLPVVSGCRLTLVYNLSRQGPDGQPLPPSYARERNSLATLLRQWDQENEQQGHGKLDGDSPVKLVYPLEHAYTAASLSFAALKGADAAKAATLLAASKDAGCDLHLALVSIEESGIAEYSENYRGYRRGRSDDDDEEFEVTEVCDRSETLSGWWQPEGGDIKLGDLPIAQGEVSPPDAFDDMDPDELSFHEATGNEGASFERSYRRAALVLWPSRQRLAVINQGGLRATLPYIADLTERWDNSGGGRSSHLWAEAHELSGHMFASWPKQRWQPAQPPSDATRMLTLLSRLGDTERIDAFLANLTTSGLFSRGDSESVVQAMRLLPQPRASELLERVVVGNAAAALDACADLLACAVAVGEFDLIPAAATLVSALPGDPTRMTVTEPWKRSPATESGMVVNVLIALDRIDPALADAAVGIFLGWPKTYNPDAVLVPAALALNSLSRSIPNTSPAASRLRAACAIHLRTRIAEPLAPPGDWTRAATLTCRCKYCAELSSFLADPTRQTWSLKSLQEHRSHVENTIRNSHCDLDTATLRRGSPHSLVCTKNQASYERRAQQRKKDIKDLARLEVHAG
jgi:predicted 2-oxoglutarate/Fe(II)-dependent dioxygenase YbiX